MERFIALPGPLPGMIVQRAPDGTRQPYHQSLDEPGWVGASFDDHMLRSDAVLAFVVGGRAYALPWWVLKNHHVANLTFDAGPVMAVL